MATTLSMKFGLASGDTRSISLSNPAENLQADTVQTCMNSIISAGSAFVDEPISALNAQLIERNVTVLIDNE